METVIIKENRSNISLETLFTAVFVRFVQLSYFDMRIIYHENEIFVRIKFQEKLTLILVFGFYLYHIFEETICLWNSCTNVHTPSWLENSLTFEVGN